jgi:hypothetical protein
MSIAISESKIKNNPEFEGESEGESNGLINYYGLIKNILQKLTLIVIALFISIYLFFHFKNEKNLDFIMKSFWIMLPILLATCAMWIYYAPKPRKGYFLSILYDDSDNINNKSYHKLDFRHKKTGNDWVFSGSSILDINGQEYVFLGGGAGQNDKLVKYNNNNDSDSDRFIDIIAKTNINDVEHATFSAVSFDMDNNGLDDLVVGRSNGVFLYKHIKPFVFEKIKISEANDKVPLALSITDYNKDNNPDIYISYFIPSAKYLGSMFNMPEHNRQNQLLMGLDDLKFIDVTTDTNSQGLYNTFTSAFIDLNNDTFPDLVVANDSGELEILENVEGITFKTHNPYDFKGNWMGIASGDIDNDGDQDLFLTNVGNDIAKNKLSLGDIKNNQKQSFQHVLLRNDGNFKFVDITPNEMKDGFGWGAILSDLNQDGNIDLLFGENFLLDPLHWMFPGTGRYFENKGNSEDNNPKFERKFKYNNSNFAQTPLLADLNGDNIKDVIWINVHGDSNIYLNKQINNYLLVKVPETTEYVNANVKIYYFDENNKHIKIQTKQIIQGGIGFGSNQSNKLLFGLGQSKKINKVTVNTIHGKIYTVTNPKINSEVILKNIILK